MPVMTEECLTGVRLMICMAKADGVLHPDERYNLEDELAGLTLPDGLTVEKLIEETNDPRSLALQVKSPEARDYIYASVFSIAYCDKHLHEAEQRLLEMLRVLWNIKREDEAGLIASLDMGKRTEQPAGPLAEACSDEAKREEKFKALSFRYCVLTGLTGAIPVPLVPDLMVVPMQVKMVYDIASLFGMKTDKNTVRLMFETLGVGTGARIGISVLSKLVPGWGSVVGATSSYATTYALAKVAYAFYKSGAKVSMESLKPMFREQKEQGKAEYEKQKGALVEAQRAHSGKLQQLAFDLSSGKITTAEYENRVDELK
ncbi:MAG TPA: hypothetical protein VEJ63_13165 [Planctomycetota bacterium]|nr:hypothetical protein [Planctomycetota bacterium]